MHDTFTKLICLLERIKEMKQVMYDIITDYILASFIQYTSNPITSPNTRKLEYIKKKGFSKICQPDINKNKNKRIR